MRDPWPGNSRAMVFTSSMMFLLFVAACGAAATSTPMPRTSSAATTIVPAPTQVPEPAAPDARIGIIDDYPEPEVAFMKIRGEYLGITVDVDTLKASQLPVVDLNAYDLLYYHAPGDSDTDALLALPVNAIRDYLGQGGVMLIDRFWSASYFHREMLPYGVYLLNFDFRPTDTTYIEQADHPVFSSIQARIMPGVGSVSRKYYGDWEVWVLDEPDPAWTVLMTIDIDSENRSRKFSHRFPALLEAKYGAGSLPMLQARLNIDESPAAQQLRENIYDYLLERANRGGRDAAKDSSLRPSQITDHHIALMQDIQDQVQSGAWSQEQAEVELGDLVAEAGKDGLVWFLWRMPVYDPQADNFVTFDTYTKGLAGSGSSSGTMPRAQEDPIGTAVDLLFGNPSTDQIRDWFGAGN